MSEDLSQRQRSNGDDPSPFRVLNLKVVNEGKATGVPILTGIGYFDHMIDQLNSHAQVGIGLQVEKQQVDTPSDDQKARRNRLAREDQKVLLRSVGQAVGRELKSVIASVRGGKRADEARFCCPLDEALVECRLRPSDAKGELTFGLAPYGIYPKKTGRTRIGSLETSAIEEFWRGLAAESYLNISLTKIRGDNAHHICESAFKAFSRALRTLLDSDTLWSVAGDNHKASAALARQGKIERQTKETSIKVHLKLSQAEPKVEIDTGLVVLDKFYAHLADTAQMDLLVKCNGDLWVDDHHSAEDVSIAIGQCLTQALGTKAGLNRMWLGKGKHNDATVEVTMDLSNRPYLGHDLHDILGRQEYVDDDLPVMNGDGHTASKLSCEMMEHVLDSLVMNGRMTVHVVQTSKESATVEDTVIATAKAFGSALRVCAMVDCRRAGQTASSKGTLSV